MEPMLFLLKLFCRTHKFSKTKSDHLINVTMRFASNNDIGASDVSFLMSMMVCHPFFAGICLNYAFPQLITTLFYRFKCWNFGYNLQSVPSILLTAFCRDGWKYFSSFDPYAPSSNFRAYMFYICSQVLYRELRIEKINFQNFRLKIHTPREMGKNEWNAVVDLVHIPIFHKVLELIYVERLTPEQVTMSLKISESLYKKLLNKAKKCLILALLERGNLFYNRNGITVDLIPLVLGENYEQPTVISVNQFYDHYPLLLDNYHDDATDDEQAKDDGGWRYIEDSKLADEYSNDLEYLLDDIFLFGNSRNKERDKAVFYLKVKERNKSKEIERKLNIKPLNKGSYVDTIFDRLKVSLHEYASKRETYKQLIEKLICMAHVYMRSTKAHGLPQTVASMRDECNSFSEDHFELCHSIVRQFVKDVDRAALMDILKNARIVKGKKLNEDFLRLAYQDHTTWKMRLFFGSEATSEVIENARLTALIAMTLINYLVYSR